MQPHSSLELRGKVKWEACATKVNVDFEDNEILKKNIPESLANRIPLTHSNP